MLLYQTLMAQGLAAGRYQARPDDGLTLVDCRIVNAVRCVPPENRPKPAEIAACNRFLLGALTEMPNLETILALGVVAHDAVLKALGVRRVGFPFAHGALHALPQGLILADSYHVSRYNTSTRRLTAPMFQSVVAAIAHGRTARG
jgi:uracil-DNA glycosylase family 4